MFASAPLTGTGPGSCEWSSVPVYPEDTGLTASAHGEQVEALGELGLLGGGAAVVIVSFGLAAALDFDWDYPVLLALLAIAAAVLIDARLPTLPRSDAGTPHSPAVLSWATSVSAVVLAITAMTGILVQTGGHRAGPDPLR